MSEDLKARLQKSDAVVSLISEQTVANNLRELGWKVFHSFYYTDTQTNKIREMDVVAERQWRFQDKNGGESVYRLKLIIECKTAKDFHLIFSPLRKKTTEDILELLKLEILPTNSSSNITRSLHYWIGEHSFRQLLLERFANKFDLRKYQKLSRILEELAYPDNNLGIEFVPCPEDIFIGSSFRETNTKITKDIENSVFWRAYQSILSTIDSELNHQLNSFMNFVEKMFNPSEDVEINLDTILIKYFNSEVKSLTTFHPLIVIDSHLWTLCDEELTEVSNLRFEQIGQNIAEPLWVDVVNSSDFSSFANKLTNYYNQYFDELMYLQNYKKL